MSTPSDELNLLLVDADAHEPSLPEGLPGQSHQDEGLKHEGGGAGGEGGGAEDFWEEGDDPNDLAAQRWGLLVPEGPAGDRLLAVIAPLIKLREEHQDGHPALVYRIPPKLDMAGAAEWRKKHFDTSVDTPDLPRYQLILGDLDQVPLAVQQVQQADGYVGRLAFTREEGYEAYVDKVLRWERTPSPLSQGRALFYTVQDGTAATAAGHKSLVEPGLSLSRKRQESGRFPATEILDLGDGSTSTPDELMGPQVQPEAQVLFSVSHGEGAPRGGWKSPQDQRERQGAMSFGREGRLGASDFASRHFLPGGVWFMLACYGAGTPDTSAYRHWLERLKQLGQFGGRVEGVLAGLPTPQNRPFIASVPQAALENPNGPLAFMGHVDLAWTYSFSELDTGKSVSRPQRFMDIVRSVLKTDRLGISFRELIRFFSITNTELTSLVDRDEGRSGGTLSPEDRARRAHLWMLRQDLAGYILLGDPAARLPLSNSKARGGGSH